MVQPFCSPFCAAVKSKDGRGLLIYSGFDSSPSGLASIQGPAHPQVLWQREQPSPLPGRTVSPRGGGLPRHCSLSPEGHVCVREEQFSARSPEKWRVVGQTQRALPHWSAGATRDRRIQAGLENGPSCCLGSVWLLKLGFFSSTEGSSVFLSSVKG